MPIQERSLAGAAMARVYSRSTHQPLVRRRNELEQYSIGAVSIGITDRRDSSVLHFDNDIANQAGHARDHQRKGLDRRAEAVGGSRCPQRRSNRGRWDRPREIRALTGPSVALIDARGGTGGAGIHRFARALPERRNEPRFGPAARCATRRRSSSLASRPSRRQCSPASGSPVATGITRIGEASCPASSWIDSVTPNNPVWINRLDGHMALANGAAMRAAKVPVTGGTLRAGRSCATQPAIRRASSRTTRRT